MIKARGGKRAKRYITSFYIKQIVTVGKITEEVKVRVLIDDMRKILKQFISDMHFSIIYIHKDESYGFSAFSANREREIRFFVYKEMPLIFCDLQMKMSSNDTVADYIGNTALIDTQKRDVYEVLSLSLRKEGIKIEDFFNKRKFVLIRFLQGDDSQIE